MKKFLPLDARTVVGTTIGAGFVGAHFSNEPLTTFATLAPHGAVDYVMREKAARYQQAKPKL